METPREDLVLYGSQTVFKLKRKQHQNSNLPYPHHPAPGRGWRQPWRQSHWSGVSGWRLWGTCWGCWCLSSRSTGQTSPRAQHLETRLQVDGRAAAAAAGAGFSLVPSGTAGAGAAAADACSGKRNTQISAARSPQGHRRAGRRGSLWQRKQVPFIGSLQGGPRPVRRHRRQDGFNDWGSSCQLRFPRTAHSPCWKGLAGGRGKARL